jgi:hypothetical protein
MLIFLSFYLGYRYMELKKYPFLRGNYAWTKMGRVYYAART